MKQIMTAPNEDPSSRDWKILHNVFANTMVSGVLRVYAMHALFNYNVVILACLVLCWTKTLTDDSSTPSSSALPTSKDSKFRRGFVPGFVASVPFSLEYCQNLKSKDSVHTDRNTGVPAAGRHTHWNASSGQWNDHIW